MKSPNKQEETKEEVVNNEMVSLDELQNVIKGQAFTYETHAKLDQILNFFRTRKV